MKLPSKSQVLLGMSLGLWLSGCATTSSLKVPVRPSPMHSLAPPPQAHLKIPVIIALPQLGEIEKHLKNFLKEDWKKEAGQSLTKSLGTTIWWDPLDWKMEDNHLTASLHVHAKGKPTAGKGAPVTQGVGGDETLAEKVEKDLQVEVSSALHWAKDWRLEAPDFAEGDTITSHSDLDDQAKGERLLRKGTSKIHESLRKGTESIEEKAKDLWREIQEPIPMAEDIWLQIVPHSVSVGNYRILASMPFPKLESVFEITLQPNVIIGKKPFPLKAELPPLEDYTPGPPGFHIETNLKISFKEVNKLLTDPKMGILKRVIPGGGDHQIKITDMSLYGSGGQLVVEAQVEYLPVLSSKPAQLTIYLVGTPTYHEDEQLIDFPDMDFDIKTNDFLVQMAEFIAGSGIRDALRKQAIIPVGKNLDKLKQDLMKVLNRPLGHFARLKTEITSLRMEEAFVSDYGIEGRVALDGDAALEVKW